MFSCSKYQEPKVEKTNCVVRVCNTMSDVYVHGIRKNKSYALCFLKSLQMRVNCLLHIIIPAIVLQANLK